MAVMIKCPKCGAEMNIDSRVCPVCGRKRLTGKDKAEIILLIFLIFFGYVFISSMRKTASKMDKSVMDGGYCFCTGSIAEYIEYPTQENTWTT